MNHEQAHTILEQLGGSRFICITGAKNFVYSRDGDTLHFNIGGGAKNRINQVRITLTPDDTYDMVFCRYSPKNATIKNVVLHEGVYCDMLAPLFTEATGFATRM